MRPRDKAMFIAEKWKSDKKADPDRVLVVQLDDALDLHKYHEQDRKGLLELIGEMRNELDCMTDDLEEIHGTVRAKNVAFLVRRADAVLSGDLPDDQEEEGRWISALNVADVSDARYAGLP